MIINQDEIAEYFGILLTYGIHSKDRKRIKKMFDHRGEPDTPGGYRKRSAGQMSVNKSILKKYKTILPDISDLYE